MQKLWQRRPAGGEKCSSLAGRVLIPSLGGALIAILAGCASPGAPLPPSLKLPQPATDLTATRSGGQVILHWTTPARTTDRQTIQGAITAEICREQLASARAPRTTQTACNVVGRLQVSPGATEATDALPPNLTSGAPAVLAYRIQLRNSKGRTAGPSATVYAASGPAPDAITGLKAISTKPGVVLEWTHPPAPGETVELIRNLVQPPPGARAKTPRPDGLLPETDAPLESRFSAKDTGGAIDRTALAGASYRYTVERVRQVTVAGRKLEIHGEPSQPVEIAVQTTFAPDSPSGLVAAPAFSPEQKPAIDLSWEASLEPHVIGYKVYRAQGDSAWQLRTTAPVKIAAYHDTAVTAGERYRYRVTAVTDAGLESEPSAEATETAPTQ